ncbi:MAG TPA: hypothetical protein ENI07_01920 [Desulfobacterales bacterium]|nr:hypothetical protein [Desulfobacterales bacterium]
MEKDEITGAWVDEYAEISEEVWEKLGKWPTGGGNRDRSFIPGRQIWASATLRPAKWPSPPKPKQ